MTEEQKQKILDRIYNRKMQEAYMTAKGIPECPSVLLRLLLFMSRKYDNCGWGVGLVFDELDELCAIAEEMLGFRFVPEIDNYERIK